MRPERAGRIAPRPWRWLAALLVCAISACPIAASAPGAVTASGGQRSWDALGAAERSVLAAFSSRWAALPAGQQEQLLANAEHWQQQDPLQQQRLQQRLSRWLALPAAERGRLRERFAVWRALSAADRAAIQAQHQRLAALPAPQRAEARQAFAAFGDRRREFLLSADQRDLARLAAQVFPFVPAEQRAATWAVLQGMDAQQRDQLQRLARRLPPWQREALRREMLQQPADTRRAWLQQRLR